MRDRRASPLFLSARSNALHFYDPSPQRRHLQLESHYEHPSQQLLHHRAPFYQLFTDDSALLAEISSVTEPVPAVQAAAPAHTAAPAAIPAATPVTHTHAARPAMVSYRSLLDVEDLPAMPPQASSPEADLASLDSESDSEPKFTEAHAAVDPMSTQSVLPPLLPLAAYSQPYNVRSSAASIRSFRSRTSAFSWSRKRKQYSPTLDTLPLEIIDEVCKFLPQETLLAMVKTCKTIACSAYVYLYQEPRFTSTYRFAQFVSVIAHDRTLASYVHSLNLSTIESGLRGNVVYAGWRDWKYRNEPLYWARKKHTLSTRHASLDDQLGTPLVPVKSKLVAHRPPVSRGSSSSSISSSSSSGPSASPSSGHSPSPAPSDSSHPLQSPLLRQYSLSRDVPLGAILHVLRACPHLHHVDFSYLPVAPDYYVSSRNYKPTAFTSLLFVSDVPKSYTWRENETVQVHTQRELVSALLDLRELRTLKLRNLVWITKEIIKRIVEDEHVKNTLEFVDFRECGMTRGKPWALAGKVEDFAGALDSE